MVSTLDTSFVSMKRLLLYLSHFQDFTDLSDHNTSWNLIQCALILPGRDVGTRQHMQCQRNGHQPKAVLVI